MSEQTEAQSCLRLLLVVACHAPRLHVFHGEMCIMQRKCTALTLSCSAVVQIPLKLAWALTVCACAYMAQSH